MLLALLAPAARARADGPAPSQQVTPPGGASYPRRPYPPADPVEEAAVVAGVLGLSALAGALRRPR